MGEKASTYKRLLPLLFFINNIFVTVVITDSLTRHTDSPSRRDQALRGYLPLPCSSLREWGPPRGRHLSAKTSRVGQAMGSVRGRHVPPCF